MKMLCTRLLGSLRRQSRTLLLLAGIMLLATALRVWALDRSPLWWDEGNNAYFANQNLARLAEMSRLTHDTDPPAHRLALGLWLRLVGASPYTLRLLSALLGTATVLLVLEWGRWLAGRREGLLAAALVALSPALVYYSREAKAYAFVTFFGLLALYLWLRYLEGAERPRPLHYILFIVAETLAVGAHYYAAFLVIAHGLWVVAGVVGGRDRRSARKSMLRWLGAQAVVAAVLAPWVALTLRSAFEGVQALSAGKSLSLPAYLARVSATLGAGQGAPLWAAATALLALGMGAAVGLAKGDGRRTSLLAYAIVVPLACGFLSQRRLSFFSPRLLLYVTPVLCLAAALGVVRLRRVGYLLCAALVIAWLAALPAAYAPAVEPGEDLRPLAEALRASAQPGDGVIVTYIWQEGILRLLAPKARVTYHLGWFAPATVEEQMLSLFAQHPRLWLVTYRVPLQASENTGGMWLEEHAARGPLVESGAGRIVLYVLPPAQAGASMQTVGFAGGIALAYAPMGYNEAAGQALLVPLRWTLDAATSHSYSVFVHLYDRAGKLWAQVDGAPVNGLKPFPSFAPGESVTEWRMLFLPQELPCGEYVLAAGLYEPATGKRLELAGGGGWDTVVIGSVHVAAASG